MNFEALLFMPLITGSIFCVTGIIMYFFPPKKINALYGYRTKNSMKNQEQWDFSQIYSAKLLIVLGALLALSSLLRLLFNLEQNLIMFLSFALLFITVILILVLTENAITKTFKS